MNARRIEFAVLGVHHVCGGLRPRRSAARSAIGRCTSAGAFLARPAAGEPGELESGSLRLNDQTMPAIYQPSANDQRLV